MEKTGNTIYYTIGVRSFLELRKYILDLDLHPGLKEKWESAM